HGHSGLDQLQRSFGGKELHPGVALCVAGGGHLPPMLLIRFEYKYLNAAGRQLYSTRRARRWACSARVPGCTWKKSVSSSRRKSARQNVGVRHQTQAPLPFPLHGEPMIRAATKPVGLTCSDAVPSSDVSDRTQQVLTDFQKVRNQTCVLTSN